jgi:CubicO group peptidase (beta-lactamase class C family)
MRAGRLIYSTAFGMANLETDTRTTPQTVFHIGSITKQFTAAALALLSEDGKLALDDRLAKFLPDFPQARDITLRQMLTHTSGLGNFTNTITPDVFIQAARVDYDERALLAAMRATSPLFVARPGATWAYSNTAYVLLGLVIEKAADAPLAAFLQRRLFDPAALLQTAVDSAATVVRGRASGYTPNDAVPSGFDNASFISMTLPAAAGAMRSTSEDLCRWHFALLGGRLLQSESLQQMLTPIRLADGTLPMGTMSPIPNTPAVTMEYGLGLWLGSFRGRRFAGHVGSINGFAAQLRSFPAEQVSVACLFNSDLRGKAESYAEVEALRDAAADIALEAA